MAVKFFDSINRVKQDYEIGVTDEYIGCVSRIAAVTLLLPAIGSMDTKHGFVIKDESSQASVFPITIQAQPTEEINGASTYVMNVNYGTAEVFHNGLQWIILNSNDPEILAEDAGGTGAVSLTAALDAAGYSSGALTCRVATTVNITDMAAAAPLQVDGVTLVAGDDVFVRAQTSGQFNGAYRVITAGSGSDGVWERASFWNTSAQIIEGQQFIVTEGNTYANRQFGLDTDGPYVLDTTVLVFSLTNVIAVSNVYYPNGNVAIEAQYAPSSGTKLLVTNTSDGNPIVLTADGVSANQGIIINQKGAASIEVGDVGCTGLKLRVDQPLLDSNGNELITFLPTGSAVNNVLIRNRGAGLGPIIGVVGDDTNVELTIAQKGTSDMIMGNSNTTGLRLFNNQPIRSGNSGQGTLLGFAGVDAAVNYIGIWQGETGVSPKLTFVGTDTDVNAIIEAQGAGKVVLGQTGCTGVQLLVNQPLLDTSGNELIAFTQTGGAVNQVNITNCGTSAAPVIGTSGGDTDIPLRISVKGAAFIYAGTRVIESAILSSDNTAGNITYSVQNVISNILDRDPNGSARADATPSAASIVTALKDVGSQASWEIVIRNQGAITEDITITGGTGVSFSGSAMVAAGSATRFLVVIDSASPGFEAITFYNLGSSTF